VAEPLVYILVLNYRAWRDTLLCLKALERLEYPNYRLLVLDNASDNDAVAQLRAAYPGLEIVELKRNLGFAGGNNVGLRQALAEGADYVWLLNPDTIPEPEALSAMVGLAEQDPRIGAVGSVLLDMDNPQQVQAWGGGEVVLFWGLIRLLTHPRQAARLSYISGASLLLRRRALEQVPAGRGVFHVRRGLRLRPAPAQSGVPAGGGPTGPGEAQRWYLLAGKPTGRRKLRRLQRAAFSQARALAQVGGGRVRPFLAH